MKKRWAVAPVLALSALLAGCSGGIGAGPGAGGVQTESEKKTITYYSWVGGAEKTFVQTLISQYEKEHPDIDIRDNYVPYGEYLSKLSTLEASGEKPDVFQMIEGKVFEWGSKGALLDLKPLFDRAGKDLMKERIPDSVFYDGTHIYGVGADIITMCLYYNKDLLEKYGVQPPSTDADHPWTWDEFEEAAIKLTRDQKDRCPTDKGFDPDSIVTYGTVMPANWTKLLALLRTNGTSYASEDGKKFNMTSPEAIEVMNRILDLSQKDRCAPDYSIGANLEANIPALIMNGQVAMMIEGSWNLSNYTNEGFDVGIAQIPMFKEPANVNWSTAYCLSPEDVDNSDAFDFLCYITDYSKELAAAKKNGVSPGSIPQTTSILDTEEGMKEWISAYSKVDETQNCQALRSILEQKNTTLGENITLKNFNVMMDNKIFPAMESVWLGEKTPEQAFSELDLSQELEGTWR